MTSPSLPCDEDDPVQGHHVPIRRSASESDISSMSRCSGATKSSQSGELPEDFVSLNLRHNNAERSFPISSQSSWSNSSEVTSSIIGSESAQKSAAVGDSISAVNVESGDGVATGSNPATANLDPSLPSAGARLHASGTCQPCLFALRATCTEGRSCAYCHLSHDASQKKAVKRPSKKVRERRQHRAVQDLSEAAGCDSPAPLPPGRVVNPLPPGPLVPGPVSDPTRTRKLVHL